MKSLWWCICGYRKVWTGMVEVNWNTDADKKVADLVPPKGKETIMRHGGYDRIKLTAKSGYPPYWIVFAVWARPND